MAYKILHKNLTLESDLFKSPLYTVCFYRRGMLMSFFPHTQISRSLAEKTKIVMSIFVEGIVPFRSGSGMIEVKPFLMACIYN